MTDESQDTSAHHATPFGMVDPQVLRDPTLGWATKLVYSLLTTYCAKARTAFPSRARMARELGISVRSVGRALTEGQERGLFVVQHRLNPSGAQTSNLYSLRDLGRGFVASVPDEGGASQARGDASGTRGSDCGAHEQDHPTRPPRQTSSSTSGNECDSSGPRTSSPTRIKIHIPADFDRRPADGLAQWLIIATVGAVRGVGVELDAEAKSRFGRAIKSHLNDGTEPRRLVGMMEKSLNDAWRGEGGWAFMFGYETAA